MKKIYTLIACTLFCLGLFAQPVNDDCQDVIDLTDVSQFCADYNSTDYTPDTEGSGCGAALNPPNMWFSFTAEGTLLDVNTLAQTGDLAVINLFAVGDITDPCNTLTNVFCADKGNFSIGGITVGQVYYISISVLDEAGDPIDTPYELCINNGDPQDNSDPCQAMDISPFGCEADQTNNLATTNINFTTQCPTGDNSQLWYTTTLDPGNHILNVQVNPSGSPALTGDVLITVGFFQAGCNGAFTIIDFNCGPAGLPIEFWGLEEGVEYYIGISSAEANEGSFSLCLTEQGPDPCVFSQGNNECTGATSINPITPSGDVPNWSCLQNQCVNNATPISGVSYQTTCGFEFNNSTVWYEVTTDATAVLMTIQVNSSSADFSFPALGLFSSCDPTSIIDCNGSSGNFTSLSNIPVNANSTYFIAVTNIDGNFGNFEFCASTFQPTTVCNNMFTMEEVGSSNDDTPTGGPYCPGETVDFCFTVNSFDASTAGSGCQWFQGIVPSFGDGWDPSSFDGNGQPNIVTPPTGLYGATWSWFEDNVVNYNTTNNFVSVFTNVHGLELCSPFNDPNCVGTPLAAGTPLPGGWFGIQPGGPTQSDGTPNTNYGDGAGCNNTSAGPWQVCFTLSTRNSNGGAEACDAQATFNECWVNCIGFPDGETGDWNNPTCIGVIPEPIIAFIDCSATPILMADDLDICTGQDININITSDQDPLTYDWTADAPPSIIGATDGTGPFISQNLTNTSNSPQVVSYHIEGKKTSCPGILDIEVTVYPEIEITLVNQPVTGCALQEFRLGDYINVSGGKSPYQYDWSIGSTDANPSSTFNETTTIEVSIQDDIGCMNDISFEINIVDNFTIDIVGPSDLCESELPIVLTATPNGGVSPFDDYEWILPESGVVVNQGTDNTLTSIESGTYILTVIDDQGCPGEGEWEVIVNDTPIITIATIPFNPGICADGDPADLLASSTNPVSTVLWETPPDYTDDIDQLDISTMVSGQYYLSVTDNNGCLGRAQVYVDSLDSPIGVEVDIEACFDPSGISVFDLNAMQNAILDGENGALFWYRDDQRSNPIPDTEWDAFTSPSATIYAYILSIPDLCYSMPIPIDLILLPEVEGFAQDTSGCNTGAGNSATFNLTDMESDIIGANTGVTVSWFLDSSFVNPIASPDAFVTSTTTVYASLTQGVCLSSPIPVNITVTTTLVANDTSQLVCQEADGLGTFNLDDLEAGVYGNLPNNVEFYTDQLLTNLIIDTDIYRSTATTIYAILRDDDGCISNLAEIELQTEISLESLPAVLVACKELDGLGTFDLTSVNATISDGAALDVVWFEDAAGTISIADPANYRSDTKSVFAMVTDGICIANIAEITLTVETTVLSDEAIIECDPGTGIGNFDLDANGQVLFTGDSVYWYGESAVINKINSNLTFSSPDTILYAIIFDGNCVSEPVLVDLSVEIGLSTATPLPFDECDPGNGIGNFDLTVLDSIIIDDPTATDRDVFWYLDAGTSNPIADPTNFDSPAGTVYAVVQDADGCISLAVAVELTVSVNIAANPASLDACDQGNQLHLFNLEDANNEINALQTDIRYYSDPAGTIEIVDPNNFSSGNATVYAIVYDGLCRSAIQPVTLTVSIQNSGNELNITDCDQGNGEHVFDLNEFNDDVSNSPSTIVWYEDALATNQIVNPTNFNTGPRTVYAVVTDVDGCISAPVTVNLNTQIELVVTPFDLIRCDEGSGTGTFDLNLYSVNILGNFPAGYSIKWYDDVNASNEILNLNAYIAPAGQTIYAVLTSDEDCISAPTAFITRLENIPAEIATAVTCDDGFGSGIFNLQIIIDEIINGNPYSVEFYEDAALLNQIVDINNYNGTAGTIYAITKEAPCQSNAVEITLELIPEIQINDISIDLCDEGNGEAIFDLSQYEIDLGIGVGQSIKWFTDAAGTQVLNNPTAFVSSGQTIYAAITNGSCDSRIAPLALSITTISGTELNLSRCDEGNGQGTFDLLANEANIKIDQSHTITWYEDITGTTTITASSDFKSGNTTIYAVLSDGKCDSEPIAVILTLSNDYVAESATIEACDSGNGTSIFDLSSLRDEINNGLGFDVKWYSDAGGLQEITAISNYNSGSVTLYAKVVDGICESPLSAQTITVNPLPNADAGQDIELTCREINSMIGGSSSTGVDFAYTWTTTNGQIESGQNNMEAIISAPGTYELSVLNTLTLCSSVDIVVVTRDVNLPNVDAGEDQRLGCLDRIVEIGTNNTDSGQDFTISWTKDGVDINTTDLILTLTERGTYVITVVNELTGCTNSDEVLVTDELSALENPEIGIVDLTCFEDNSGCVQLISVDGGVPPYRLSIDQTNYQENQICGLAAGNYTVFLRDGNNCEISFDTIINQPAILEVELIAPEVVDYGNSAVVSANTNPVDRSINLYDWQSSATFTTLVDSIVEFNELSEFTVAIRVIDENGCSATDQITIYIRKNFKIYAPNAFSPFNNDNINDRFMIMGSPDIVTSVDDVQVFDRWGEKVYERRNININDMEEGWDGTFMGSNMNPGVFGYHATVTFVDGSKGEITGEFILVD